MSSPKYERKMFYGAPACIYKNAKWLKYHSTKAEEILWQELRKSPLGYKFRRQHPIAIFIADFYCHKAKLVIEVDGDVHNKESVILKDKEREWNLKFMGLSILRFTNDEVMENLVFVMETIKSFLNKLTPSI